VSDASKLADVNTQGDPKDAEALLPRIYNELRTLAASRMARESHTITLQATALVHEAYLRLGGSDGKIWGNRAHYFAAAAEAMRRILIDRARRKRALKRDVRKEPLDLDRVDVAEEADVDTLLLINDALEKLAKEDEQAAQLVKLRFFVGLDYEKAAEALEISPRTAKRIWTFARAWLYKELSTQGSDSKGVSRG